MLIEFLKLLVMGSVFRFVAIAVNLYLEENGYYSEVPAEYGILFNAILVAPFALLTTLQKMDCDGFGAIGLLVFLFLSLYVGGWLGQDVYDRWISND